MDPDIGEAHGYENVAQSMSRLGLSDNVSKAPQVISKHQHGAVVEHFQQVRSERVEWPVPQCIVKGCKRGEVEERDLDPEEATRSDENGDEKQSFDEEVYRHQYVLPVVPCTAEVGLSEQRLILLRKISNAKLSSRQAEVADKVDE